MFPLRWQRIRLLQSRLGSGALTKAGAGLLDLSAGNTYSGATNLNGGTVQLSNINSLGSTSALNFNGGAASFQFPSVLVPVVLNSGGGELRLFPANVNLSNTISGSGAFTKTGAGTLTQWHQHLHRCVDD